MKTSLIFRCSLIVLMVHLAWASSVSAVDRTIAEQGTCSPLVAFTVTPAAFPWMIEEVLPQNCTPANIKGRGAWNPETGTITWGPFNDTITRILSYEITADTNGALLTYDLSGTFTQNGSTQAIGGVSSAQIQCADLPEQVAAPVFSPASGAEAPQSITLSCTTPGAQIRYTLDGSVPGLASVPFITTPAIVPIPVTSQTSIRARAFKDDMLESDVVSALYPEPAPADPASITRTVTGDSTCSPTITLDVTLAAPPAASYAVTDYLPWGITVSGISHGGVFDQARNRVIWGPFDDGANRSLTYEITGPDAVLDITGRASFDGIPVDTTGDSQATVQCRTVQETVAAPVFTPASGTLVSTAAPLTLTIDSTTPGAAIYYTVDGSSPNPDATPQDPGTIGYDSDHKPVFTARTRVRAIAVKSGMIPSDIVLADYPEPDIIHKNERTLSDDSSCTPSPRISVAVEPGDAVVSYAVEEDLPPGLIPDNISGSGTWDPGHHKVKWGPFNDNSDRTVSYDILGPPGVYTITGSVSANGASRDTRPAVTPYTQVTLTCPQAAMPEMTPPAEFENTITVVVSCATPGTTIYYTTDGSEPGLDSDTYTLPIVLTGTALVKAMAYGPGYAPSTAASTRYTKVLVYAHTQRSINPNADCSPLVTLTMTANESFSSWALSETIPPGLLPRNISGDGVWDLSTRTIKWGPFFDTTDRTLTYELTGGKDSYLIDGLASFDGTSRPLTGDKAVVIDCVSIPDQVAEPVLTPGSGAQTPVSVTITCATADAGISYTTDGSLPHSGSTLYASPLSLPEFTGRTLLRARAFKTGFIDSDVTSAVYPEPAPSEPGTGVRTITPEACSAGVTLVVTPENSVRSYALEENLPRGLVPDLAPEWGGSFDARSGTIKWGPFNDNTRREFRYTVSGTPLTANLTGLASFDGQSRTITGDAILTTSCQDLRTQVATPGVSPASGSTVPVDVILTCSTPDAHIYYTDDGSLPGTWSTLYQLPINLAHASTIRALAVKSGMIDSDIASAAYKAKSLLPNNFQREISINSTCYPIVKLRVSPNSEAKSWAVEESIPAGLTPSRINNSGVWDPVHRTIKWGPFPENTTRTLIYNLSSPPGSDGDYTISGIASIDGTAETIGESTVTVLCLQADDDEDGIPNGDEGLTGDCPSADDSDGDDDGLIDGLEDLNHNGIVDPGETDPCNPDTDGDGIMDGAELGLTMDDIWGDTNPAAFVPSADPTIVTDPLNEDSDGDGYYDGEEMFWGTNPNDSLDTCVYTPGTYTIEPSGGSDFSGLGTPGNPWQSLHHAILRINAGLPGSYVIQLPAGTFGALTGEAGVPLVLTQAGVAIQGTGIGSTIIQGGGIGWTTGITVQSSEVTITGITITGFSGPGIAVDASGIVIYGCNVNGNGIGILLTSGCTLGSITGNCSIYNNTTAGISIDGGSNIGISDNIASIYDNGIGVSITGDAGNITVENNSIYWSGDPLHVQTIGVLIQSTGSGNKVIGNIIYDHNGPGNVGIHAYGDPELSGNTLRDNGTAILVETYTPLPPVPSIPTASPAIINNLIHGTSISMLSGIVVKAGSGTVIPQIYHNTITGGQLDGIYVAVPAPSPAPAFDIKYNIISDFVASGIRDGMDYLTPATLNLDYNNVVNNGTDYMGVVAAATDISVDPGFMGGSDYNLQPASLSRDVIPLAAGDPIVVDYNGTARPQGPGIDVGCYEPLYADVTPPTVTGVSPADAAVDVPVISEITATFSEALAAASVNASSFTLWDGTTNIAGTVTYNGLTATFAPSDPLGYNTLYTATVTTGLQDIAGNSLAADHVWNFTTEDVPPDMTPPTITSVSPVNGAVNVPLSSVITATFSEALAAATVDTNSFTVSDGIVNITGTVTYDGLTATFAPSVLLNYNTTCTATLSTGIQDVAGNNLAAPWTWTFTTEPPPPVIDPPVIDPPPVDPPPVDPPPVDPPPVDPPPVDPPPVDPPPVDPPPVDPPPVDPPPVDPPPVDPPPVDPPPNSPPGTPTPVEAVSDDPIFLSSPVTLAINQFTDPEGDSHINTYWCIMTSDAPGCSSLIETGTALQVTLANLAPGLKYDWAVAIEDENGNVSWSDVYSFYVGEVVYGNGPSVPPGIKNTDYTMISLVQWPEYPLVADIFQSYQAETYRIGAYDPVLGRYVLSSEGLEMEPGRAYWCLARYGLDPVIKGIPVSLQTDIDVRLHYNPATGDGWNQVAPPNNADYYWSDIQVAAYDDKGTLLFGPEPLENLAQDNPYIDLRLWRWENRTYYSDTFIMEPFKGYWVRTKATNVYLRFPTRYQAAGSGLERFMRNVMFNGTRLFLKCMPTKAYAVSQDYPPMPMQ
ncbi:MAG: chitobiase/beta-hexosaminidase C-terminal domain-containing protein [Pseudomonadota bacterium]